MNEEKLKEKIIDTVKSYPGKNFRRRELYNLLKVKKLNYNDFKHVLSHLESSGILIRTKGRKFLLPEQVGMITGIFNASKKGGGYVRLPDGESIFIRRGKVNIALTGDTVQVRILKKKRIGPSHAGEILKIIERSTMPILGIFKKYGSTAFLIPQKAGFSRNLLIKNSEEHNASNGDLVLCRMEMPSAGYSRPMCTMYEVLGDPDSPGIDVLAIAKRYELPVIFPEEVLKESENIQSDIAKGILEKRRDIRDMVTFTIDPEDAKDFDDALSISRIDSGGFELGVHIADVSHYIKAESAMDREAQMRGMSCYLVDRVIPMLPNRLSDDLCSLKPSEDRLTKSVFAVIDEKGKVIRHEIANTVIHSRMRLTYEQVQAYIDGNISHGADEITSEVGEALKILSELTDIFIECRNKRGTLDLELPETKVVLNDENKPVDIVKRDRLKAHRMVEEAMLLANTITAETLAKAKVPFLYRIHDKPAEEKLTAFGEIAHSLGYDFDAAKSKDQKYIQHFLLSIQGKEHEHTLNMMLLRSMKKAGYSPRNIGHFGLALEKYAHFTSPIRRYPDLIVHRQIDAYNHGNGDELKEHELSYYDTLGDYLTEREIIIDSAERDSIKMKKAEFMMQYVGEEFEGTVTGIVPAGIFVGLDTFFVEGFIHVSSLDDDYYEMDSAGFAMVGQRKKKRYMIGDRLKVVVASAVKERGEVNFMLIEKIKRKKK